jgi:hypothetical protein
MLLRLRGRRPARVAGLLRGGAWVLLLSRLFSRMLTLLVGRVGGLRHPDGAFPGVRNGL